MAMQFESRKVALKQDRTGFVLTLSIHPDEIPEELLRDFVGARYGVAMVRIQDDESATPYTNRVQKAGMLCRSPQFQDFMKANSEDEAAQKLCARCGITSRSELNGNYVAQQSFDNLVTVYETWSSHDDNTDPF
jgi:hypothetical protein